jgi:hypothetical protein
LLAVKLPIDVISVFLNEEVAPDKLTRPSPFVNKRVKQVVNK